MPFLSLKTLKMENLLAFPVEEVEVEEEVGRPEDVVVPELAVIYVWAKDDACEDQNNRCNFV